MTLKDFINQLHTVVDKSIPFKDDLSICQVTDVIIKDKYVILKLRNNEPKYFQVNTLVRKLLTLDEDKDMFTAYTYTCYAIRSLTIRKDVVIIHSNIISNKYVTVDYGR